jgi:hypothetical protein
VADPGRPAVVDGETLGDTTPVVSDHHAFVDLGGGRFAVPASSWGAVQPTGCTPAQRDRLEAEAGAAEPARSQLDGGGTSEDAGTSNSERPAKELWSDPCLSPAPVVDTTVVVADTAGRAVDVAQRISLTTPEPGTRLLPTGERWAVLAGTHLLWVDPAGTVVADLALA